MINPALEEDFPKVQSLETDGDPREQKPSSKPRVKRKKKPSKQVVRDDPLASHPASKRLYPLKDAARYLGRSEWGMRELIWAKKIPVVREVRKIYLDINDLDEYINRNKALYD